MFSKIVEKFLKKQHKPQIMSKNGKKKDTGLVVSAKAHVLPGKRATKPYNKNTALKALKRLG